MPRLPDLYNRPTLVDTMSAELTGGALIQELEYGEARADVVKYAAVCRRLADDAQSMTGAPAAFFRFDALRSAGDMRPLDVPSIPLSSPQSGSGNRGWAFATWLQIAPPPAGEARASSILLARLTSAQSAMDTEIWLYPLDTPQLFRIVVKLQPGQRGGGRKAPFVEGNIKLPSLRWHHLAVSQTQPYIKLIKPPRLSLFLDGQLVFEAVRKKQTPYRSHIAAHLLS